MPTLATITVLGKDRTGVVARMTGLLFDSGANIEALEEEVTRGWFSMVVQASWKRPVDRDALARAISRAGRELGMETKVRFAEPGGKKRMAVLVTKEPRCPEALLAACAAGRLKATPAVMVGNHRTLEPLARKRGVPFVHVPFTDRAKAEAKLLAALDEHAVDFLVLARFMKILSPQFVWRYRNRIINIHPSLLPAFPGASAYRQAYEKGVRVVGVTAHFVTPSLDEGPIIHQDAFRVAASEPLASIVERGQKLEAKVLVKAVDLYLRRQLDVHWGRVWG